MNEKEKSTQISHLPSLICIKWENASICA